MRYEVSLYNKFEDGTLVIAGDFIATGKTEEEALKEAIEEAKFNDKENLEPIKQISISLYGERKPGTLVETSILLHDYVKIEKEWELEE